MPLKLFKLMWFLSVLALLATLLYDYAGWQEEVILQEEHSGNLVIGRELLFYLLAGTFALVNVLVYLIRKMVPEKQNFRAWFHGLIITINIFFIIAMNLIGLYNSTEKFDYSRIGFIVYGSIGLILAWAIAWPFYAVYQKFFIKQTV